MTDLDSSKTHYSLARLKNLKRLAAGRWPSLKPRAREAFARMQMGRSSTRPRLKPYQLGALQIASWATTTQMKLNSQPHSFDVGRQPRMIPKKQKLLGAS